MSMPNFSVVVKTKKMGVITLAVTARNINSAKRKAKRDYAILKEEESMIVAAIEK